MKQPKNISSITLIKRIIGFAKPFRKWLVIVFACILAITVNDACNSYLLSKIFDIVQKHSTDTAYLPQALLYVGMGLVLLLIRIVIVRFQGRLEIKQLDLMIQHYLNHQSIAKFFSFSNGQHINEHSGVKQSIVNSGTTSIQNQIRLMLYQLFPSLAYLVVSLGILFSVNVVIGSVFLTIGIVFTVMMFYLNKQLVPGVRKIRDRVQLNSRLISELYRYVGVVKNEAQEHRSLSDVSVAQSKQQDIFSATWLPAMNRLTVIRSTTGVIRYCAIAIAVYLLFQGKLGMGGLFLIFSWSGAFMNSLWDLTGIHKNFLLDRINIEKYFQLLEVEPDIQVVENPIRPTGLYGHIEFKNVTFSYPERLRSYEHAEEGTGQNHPVLKNISFTVEAGQKIGIVGESGSGKSTLGNLLRRAFDPQSGQILIDGHDLRLLDLKWFLQNLGSVEQEVVVFDRSIKDNILFGYGNDITKERLDELAKIARIDAFFGKLEHGYDTLVGEKGVKLSGGERQRIGIARALAKNPSILLFDEATSALDSISEKIVQESIEDACKGKTAIIIAHRLSTVKNCDKILVFRNGVLLAQGTHDALIHTSEYYADLVKHQLAV